MSTSVLDAFQSFRSHLDEHNDRRERLIKASRDITNISKKTIFLLHRIVLEAHDASDERIKAISAARQGREKLKEVQDMYATLKDELAGDRFWRYQRQVSPGLQEYIEALSFAHFVEHETLMTFSEVQQTLCSADGVPYFPLTIADYLLGVSDLTGELMRLAISSFGRRGGRSKASETCVFVRNCKADFERFTPYIWELNKKQHVTAQSLMKIEDAVYAAAVRSSEFDLSSDMLDNIVDNILSYHDDSSYAERDY